ncbi:MBL fold metallo-hydrolase [Candidatus Daviesbacteria bacterium]|nr:MBL fold metallo-hydrolase [Candidatus Daviesbacteria bacterium]
MDIYWYGQAFFRIKGKQANILIDPFDSDFTGLKLPKDLTADIALKTHDHQDHSNLKAVVGNPIKIQGPGEYEIKGVSISGVSVFHDNSQGSERGENTIYNLEVDGLNIVHLGDLGHILTEQQIQQIGLCGILLVPVGGTYTINSQAAAEVVAQLEPRIIIPMHYGGIPGLKFPLDSVDLFLKEMGVEKSQPLPKLSISKDKLPEEPQVILLEKV